MFYKKKKSKFKNPKIEKLVEGSGFWIMETCFLSRLSQLKKPINNRQTLHKWAKKENIPVGIYRNKRCYFVLKKYVMPWLGYYELSSSSYDNEGYLRQVVVPVTKENLEKYSLSHRLPVAYQEGDSLENDQYFLKKSLNNSNIKTNFNYDINSNENTRISEIEALKSELLEQKQLLNSLLSDLSESKKSQEKEIAYIHGGHLQLVEGISFIPEKEVKN